ncbi:norbelladine synthase-like [Bidens hawaiensis]|uniref:norbelladine synthase-like n=1 Tax=Bidens hawaiensis TaxID=980011 RepID=UPI00404A3807
MFGTLSEEAEVNVPASKAWALYGTIALAKLVSGKILQAVDVVEGDGGPGTVVNITCKPGAEVKVPASKAWVLYGTLEIGKILAGTTLEAVDVVEGDGGPGTIQKLTFKTGSGFTYGKEKFTKVDNANMIKESEAIEGGFLDIGFDLYRVRIEIKENPKDGLGASCFVKLTVEYNVKEEFVANASFVTTEPLIAIMSVANEHLLKSS